MRRHGLVLLCTLVLAAVAARAARAHSTPQIRAERAHAQAVVAEINRIGRNLEAVVQRYDGARLELQRVKRSLRRNESELRVARSNSQLIDRAESAQVLSNQDAALGQQALRFERAVQRRERQLQRLKRRRETTVAGLAAQRRTIQSALGRQQRLLASIHTTIRQLQAQEAARERRLRAEAERRLQQELAARQAAARAAAAQAATAQPAAPAAPSPAPPGVVQAPTPSPLPVPSSSAGHPEAAQIALRYLGVPYVWGGASPSGFDCSGLVMYVYAQLGISLPHYTVAQWDATLPISASQMEPGDLVFFDGLGHVGIYIGNGQFVDAPHTGAVVRIDSLASWGGSFVGARR